MQQLALDLGIPTGPRETVRSATNRDALALLERWPHWPHPVQFVLGPRGSGKTHLAGTFAAVAGATLVRGDMLCEFDPITLAAHPVVLDDAENADERSLFHLFNAMRASGQSMLLTAGEPLSARIPDLASRLRQVPHIQLLPPDDALLSAVMREAFTRRQLPPDPQVIAFLLPRMERTLHDAVNLVAMMDRAGLAARQGPTRPLAARILSQGSRCGEHVP